MAEEHKEGSNLFLSWFNSCNIKYCVYDNYGRIEISHPIMTEKPSRKMSINSCGQWSSAIYRFIYMYSVRYYDYLSRIITSPTSGEALNYPVAPLPSLPPVSD